MAARSACTSDLTASGSCDQSPDTVGCAVDKASSDAGRCWEDHCSVPAGLPDDAALAHSACRIGSYVIISHIDMCSA